MAPSMPLVIPVDSANVLISSEPPRTVVPQALMVAQTATRPTSLCIVIIAFPCQFRPLSGRGEIRPRRCIQCHPIELMNPRGEGVKRASKLRGSRHDGLTMRANRVAIGKNPAGGHQ